MTKGLNESAKNIDTCQAAQCVQADPGRNVSLSVNFLRFKVIFPSLNHGPGPSDAH